MRYADIFRESVYQHQYYWFNPATGEEMIASDTTHSEMVLKDPEAFGVSKQDIDALGAGSGRHWSDWNAGAIRLANDHGWVRVHGEGRPGRMELSLQSTSRRDLMLAARRYVPKLEPIALYVDMDLKESEPEFMTKMTGPAIDYFCDRGRFRADLVEAKKVRRVRRSK